MAAANDVFVGFFALWDAADEHHTRALRLQSELARRRRQFLTSDYIVDETVTLLLVRHSHTAASDFLQTVTTTEWLQLEWVDSDRFHAAANLFIRHHDKEWSFPSGGLQRLVGTGQITRAVRVHSGSEQSISIT